MKNKFPGYIDHYLENSILTKDKILIVFDTNILLNLYRYEKTITDDILLQIKHLKKIDFSKYGYLIRSRLSLIYKESQRSQLKRKRSTL